MPEASSTAATTTPASKGLADFVHLRVHGAYSLSEGAIRIKDLVARCVAERMPAVAPTRRPKATSFPPTTGTA